MKLKFIHSLVAVALVVGAAGSFSSCKDTDEDMYLKLQDQNTTLQEKMDAQVKALQGQLSNLETLYNQLKAAQATCCNDVKARLDVVEAELAKGFITKQEFNNFINNEYTTLQNTVSTIEGNLSTLESTITTIQNTVVTAKDFNDSIAAHRAELTTLAQQYAMVQGAVTTLQSTVTNLSTDLGNAVTDLRAAEANITSLQGTVSTLVTDLATVQGTVNTLVTDVAQLQADVTKAQTDATNALNKATTNEGKIASMQEDIEDMDSVINWIIENMNPAAPGCDCDLTGIRDSIKANLDSIVVLRADIEKYRAEAASNLAQAKAALMNRIDSLDAALSGRIDRVEFVADSLGNITTSLGTQITTLNSVVVAQGVDINDLKTRVAALETSDGIQNAKIQTLETEVSKLDSELTALKARVAANEAKIQEIENKLDNLTDRVSNLENRISGVVIQQVSNPVFGCINVPADIKSMILFNYWGQAFANLQFPDFSGNTSTNYGTTYNDIDGDLLEQIDFVNLTAGQDFMNEEVGNMGQVYFTVNPTNVDLTGKDFTLENSAGQQSKITLHNVRPCTETLTFGVHHAPAMSVSPNGFYMADAYVSMTDVHDIRIHIENGLKGDIKDALKNRSLSSLATVAGVVFKQLNGKVPALGLKATWNEVVEGVSTNHSVYSEYSIAGTSYRPLSYGTAFNTDLSGRIPALPDLDKWYDKFVNLENDLLNGIPTFKFTNKELEIKPLTVTVGQISPIVFDLSDVTVGVDIDKVTVSVNVTCPDKIEVYDDNGDVVGTVPAGTITASGTGSCTNLTELNGAIEEAIRTAFSSVQDKMNEQMAGVVDDINGVLQDVQDNLQEDINDMIKDINKQFDKLLSDLEKDVNQYIEDVKETIQDEVNGRVESVFKRIKNYYRYVENVYNRVYNLLKDPNHYMQVTMLYSYDGGFGRMSNSKAAPTVFKGAGNATTLVPTTFNAEILSPAYKKYVAVTDVFDANGNSAKGGNDTCIKLLQKANAGEYMNTPINGERRTVAFNFDAAKAQSGNYTYEIFYQAVDYHGLTSTQKFYVTIKNN